MYSFGVAMFVAFTGSIKLFNEVGERLKRKEEVDAAKLVE